MSTRPLRRAPQLLVRRLSARATAGWLVFGGLRMRCALGRGGIRAGKREGDGATPFGRFRVHEVLYNPRRVQRPVTGVPVRPIARADGWCDAPGDRNYNRFVRHPYRASAERLWRDDGLYDLVVVLDYNIRPRVQGRGSAVFMHVARPGFQATEGCIAVERDHLRRILSRVTRTTPLITAT